MCIYSCYIVNIEEPLLYMINNKALSPLSANERRTKGRIITMMMMMTEKQVSATARGHKSLRSKELNERWNEGLANQERLKMIFPFLVEEEGYY